MRIVLVTLILFMSIAVNLPDSVIARLGFDPDYLKAALLAVIIAGLTRYHNLALMVLVVLLSIAANMPLDMARELGVDRDVFTATLVAIVLSTRVSRWFD